SYSIVDVSKMILSCRSREEVEAAKDWLLKNLDSYSIPDQGFLLAIVGMQIMKVDDSNRSFERFLGEFILGSVVISSDNRKYMDVSDPNHPPENARRLIESSALNDHMRLAGNTYKIEHKLSPEEVAKTIWAQWLTIRKLVSEQTLGQTQNE